MTNQHCILETLSEAVATLEVLLGRPGVASRTAFAREVCREFGFRDSRGRLQLASCQRALRSLHEAGRPIPAPVSVPRSVGEVRGLRLTLVTSQQQRQCWNELVDREHPQGAVIHVGAQVRYLIESEHGLLGAIGFAASALAVAARDEWIGWDADSRRQRLHRVVALSRFLIRPSAQCRFLASKTLSMVMRRLPQDFRQIYGYRPALVETYIDSRQHAGTCFQAANWTCVGQTIGRGRFAPPGQRVPVKTIYVYSLQRDWRRVLGGSPPPQLQPLEPGEGLALDKFAANELGGAPLGDKRLSKRLVETARMQAAAPMASIPSAARGKRAAIKGHYRLIDRPEQSAVTPENILAPHRGRTLRRMQGERTVLCVQDGTDLTFAEYPGCAGLGLIGTNATPQGTRRLHMHSTMALSTEGIPLGVPQIQFEAPDGRGQRGQPPEEPNTSRWIRSLRECAALAARLKGTRAVSVMDRKGDARAVFEEQRELRRVEVLVRARHKRVLGERRWRLFDRVRQQRAGKELVIEIQPLSARRDTRRQEARTASVSLRWRTVELPGRSPRKGPLPLQLVHVWEEEPPEGAEPVEWYLITTLPVDSSEAAERILNWYRLRWRITGWHRILKTGCKVEYLGHRTRERIQRAVTIKAVIAWRLAAMTLLGQETPELPDAAFLAEGC